MKKYIKYSTDIIPKEEIINITDTDIIDISADPDDTYYTVDSFEDYLTFVNKAVV